MFGATAALVLAAALVLTRPPPSLPPGDVVRVVGDAVAIRWPGEAPPEVLLDGVPTPVAGVSPGLWEVRGLAPGQDLRLLVRGVDHATPIQVIRAAPPAVAARLELSTDRSVQVHLRRPVRLGWSGGAPAQDYPRGTARLAAPPEGHPPELLWREAGLGFRRRVDWSQVQAQSLAPALAATAQDPGTRLRSAFLAGEGPDLDRPWEPWYPLASWIPSLLGGPSGPSARAGWQRAQRSVAQARLLGLTAAGLSVSAGALGWRGSLEAPAPGRISWPRRGIEGGTPDRWRPGEVPLKPPGAPAFEFSLGRDAAAEQLLLGPRPAMPGSPEALWVGVRVARFDPRLELVLETSSRAEPVGLWSQVDGKRPGDLPLFDGWLAAVVPARALPPRSTATLRVRALLQDSLWTARIREVAVALPPAPPEADAEDSR